MADRASRRFIRFAAAWAAVAGLLLTCGAALDAGADEAPAPQSARAPAAGPLRAHPDNPRYFTDGTKGPGGSLRAVYLTGSHHWNNLQDTLRAGKPVEPFDYDGYLHFMQAHGHNFMRLWAWEDGENDVRYEPVPYARTESGKYDLTRFNEAYFTRLRERVAAAGERGIYVSVMLFQGWSIYSHGYGNPWPVHPFNRANNVNGIDGDPDHDGEGKEVHSLAVAAVTRLQEAYVRRVVDAVNDLDNVLYEVTNETAIHSKDWQYHVVNYLKQYEATKPKQHPVGMTAFDSGRAGSMKALLEGPADWISPQNDGTGGDYQNDPPAADGCKVILSDTDHLWGVGGGRDWVWRSFTRGLNPIYMDPLGREAKYADRADEMEGARRAMGDTRAFAERVSLASMKPAGELASTRYCLADAGREYLVYLPMGGAVTVDLSAATGELDPEWFDPVRRTAPAAAAAPVAGGAKRELKAPFAGPAVLYLKVKSAAPSSSRRTGPVRLHGHSLADDGGRFNALGASLFFGTWAYKHDRARLERSLGTLARHGFDYVRVLGVVGDPKAPESWDGRESDWRDPDYAKTIAGLTDLAYDKFGLRVEWTLIGDGQKIIPDRADRFRLADTFLAMSRGREQKIVLFEVANESWQNGFGGADGERQLRELTKYLNDRTDILVAASAGADAAQAKRLYAGGVADVATVHFDRDVSQPDGHWRPVRMPWEHQFSGLPVGASNEPIGPGSSVAAENDPVKLVAAALATYTSGLPMYVFHSKAGIRGRDELADMPGVGSFAHLKQIVPADLASWDPKDARQPDAPFRTYGRDRAGEFVADARWPDLGDGATGAVRAYGAVKGDEFFVVPIGVRGPLTLEPRRAVAFDVIDPMTGKVLERKQLDAGQRFDLTGRELFVLRGHFR